MNEKLFNVAGIAFIIVAIFGFIGGWNSIDHDTYDTAKEVYEELWDNEYAEASFNAAKSLWITEVYNLITVVSIILFGGFVLLGIGTIIKYQREIALKLTTNENKEIA
ncbi:hypothetical protein LCM23_14690 [Cytobacillus kochii]|uniref:hypothetical protein n=1 Tax=Cytobacillus kochii TaxID=859143 RepID=UPI001CD33268|nr:hypothetical protein [Cytobacillus kochii]MCA1027343.1 hypothetical protein [Cytobacillus kochii]